MHHHNPTHITIHGAHVHNLKNIDVNIPLHQLVAISGVSGSGKSSLALGVLYAEGSRRYLESLSTYTRRRMSSAVAADVDEIDNVPAALALHQRPSIGGIRSTFGTATELLNTIRLMVSRLGSHPCNNGHLHGPTIDNALGKPLICPICGDEFHGPSAEALSFNSTGACPHCGGTGTLTIVDETTLVPDESLTIEQGAVAPWNSLMWSLMVDVCRAMGVRTNVPFNALTDHEKDIVYHGPAEKKHILYRSKKGDDFAELDFTYYNAVYTVENALANVKDEKGMKRVEKFLKTEPCPYCNGTRLSDTVRASKLCGKSLDEICKMPLDQLIPWVNTIPEQLPDNMREMAKSIIDTFNHMANRLMDLGLGYLSLDRTSATLSTGERQRVALARAVRNRSNGVMYVLDEPSIGLHPSNIDGLMGMIEDLLDHGNTIILVDHDTRVLNQADHMIEMGPGAGVDGGTIIAQGSIDQIKANPNSVIAPYLGSNHFMIVREKADPKNIFDHGTIHMVTDTIHTVHPLDVTFPKSRLIAVTGVSGSGKTTMILESLIPAITASIAHQPLPSHVQTIVHNGITTVNLIDATPIGANVRSTMATYSAILDELRKLYAKTQHARSHGLKASDFSYNTGSLRCQECDGTGHIMMDVQFLPDVEIQCPSCHGKRYSDRADHIVYDFKLEDGSTIAYSLPQFLSKTIHEALGLTIHLPKIHDKLSILDELGLGYLTLNESTPALSGGEAQRLKLAAQMRMDQTNALFVFDEPTIGLHPKDVATLLNTLDELVSHGATVIVIEHDLDFIANADYVIDMGPGGGINGGQIIATGTPEDIRNNPQSITGKYLNI